MKAFLIYSVLFITGVFGQTVTVPVDMQVNTIPKILSLSKNFEADTTTGKMAVIYSSVNRNSTIFRDEVKARLSANKIVTRSRTWRIEYIDISKIKSLKDILIRNQIKVVYLAPLRGYDIRKFADIFRELKILSFSSVAENIESEISVSFDVINDNMKILIHQDSAKEVNANFSSYLLKLALLK